MNLPLPQHPIGQRDRVLGLDRAGPRWLQRPVLARHADRDLGAMLDKELGGLGGVLHDVAFLAQAALVDHVVVAPSGIWIVDSLHLRGRVERREHGTRRDGDARLYLDGVERTDLVDQLGILRQAHSRMNGMHLGDVPIHRVVCIIDAVWPVMARPFQVRDIWITWPRALSEKIRSSGLLPVARARAIAETISACVVEHV